MQANDNTKLISLNDVAVLTSLSRTYLNKLRDADKFPAAVPLGDKRIAFIESEVMAWINERIAARGQRAA